MCVVIFITSLLQRHRVFFTKPPARSERKAAKCNARSRQRNGVECHETKRAHSTENHSKIKML